MMRVREFTMSDHKPYVLFLCSGNSARSILAEAIANQQFGEHLRAVSAGARPKAAPHEMTLATLTRHGLSTDGLHSKNWDEFMDEPFDIVITLCDDAAREQCPNFPGPPDREHWSLPDPPAADLLGILVHGNDPDVHGRAHEARIHLNHRFTPRMI